MLGNQSSVAVCKSLLENHGDDAQVEVIWSWVGAERGTSMMHISLGQDASVRWSLVVHCYVCTMTPRKTPGIFIVPNAVVYAISQNMVRSFSQFWWFPPLFPKTFIFLSSKLIPLQNVDLTSSPQPASPKLDLFLQKIP